MGLRRSRKHLNHGKRRQADVSAETHGQIMSNEEVRFPARPSVDMMTTLIWTHDSGHRLRLYRMYRLLTQDTFAPMLGIDQQLLAKIESNRTDVVPRITVADLKAVVGKYFNFIVMGPDFASECINSEFAVKRYQAWRKEVRKSGSGQHGKQRGAYDQSPEALERLRDQAEIDRLKAKWRGAK